MTETAQKSQADRFREKGEEVSQFVEANNRFPSTKSEDSDERSLGSWWSRNLTRLRRNEMSDHDNREIIHKLLEHSSASDLTVSATWEQRHADLNRFHFDHGRLPKSNGNSGLEGEHALATWMIQQRMNFKAGTLKPVRTSKLSEIPGALETFSHKTTDARLEEAKSWCEEHGFLPRANPSSNTPYTGEDKVEAGIANWMRNHLRAKDVKKETPEVIARRAAINELYAQYPSRSEWKAGKRKGDNQ